jgi:leucyl-tRNA synthetase
LKFNRQFVIQHADILGKKSYFIADFHCFSKKIIVEIDGKIHDSQVEYDEIRTEILEEMGYKIIRFKNKEVLNNWGAISTKLEKVIVENKI